MAPHLAHSLSLWQVLRVTFLFPQETLRQGSEPGSSPVLTLPSCQSQDPSLLPRNPHPHPAPTQLNILGLLTMCTMLCSLQSSFHIWFDLCHKIEGERICDYYHAQVRTEAQKGQGTLSGTHSQERSEGGSESWSPRFYHLCSELETTHPVWPSECPESLWTTQTLRAYPLQGWVNWF